MEWLEPIEHKFSDLVEISRFFLELLSAVCVIIGLVQSLRLITKATKRRRHFNFPFVQLRLQFGLWLSLALELQLGADILETTIAPNLEFLTRLGILAAIRTFLNYFLHKELEEEEDKLANNNHEKPPL